MTIRKLGTGAYVDYSLAGTVLTIDGEAYDLAALQQDSQVIKDVRRGVAFAASIEIPPKKYKQVDTVGDGAEHEVLLEAEALDVEAVTLNLWPLPVEEKNMEEN